MNYQGYLTNAAGVPISGTVQMVFSVYYVPTGGTATALWTETQNVTVTNGIYNVNLGEVTPMTLAFDVQYYLGVAVGTDPEMTPRQTLTSMGYAFRAEVANTVVGSGTFSNPIISTVTTGTSPLQVTSTTKVTNLNSDLLDGLHASDFASATHTHDDRYYTKAYVNALEARIAALETLLAHFTRIGNEILITGANLYILSGSGSTGGTVNGLGNLIIGYNEVGFGTPDRSGSHNLVVGRRHNYSSYGGIVAGDLNSILGPFASVSGGLGNTATGSLSSISGGLLNAVSGNYSSVTGGTSNIASGAISVVGGGENNTSSGTSSSVSGGRYNTASGSWSHVSGGGDNTAGSGNEAYSDYSSILGGSYNHTGDYPSGERTVGLQATIAGGYSGNATGNQSTVSGGYLNEASGLRALVGGGYSNTASGQYSSVSAGRSNTASGYNSTVSGGHSNTASTSYATVSGALPQYDSGWVSIANLGTLTLTHNLGGDVNDYIVDVQFYDSGGFGVNHRFYGRDKVDSTELGAYWYGLDSDSIVLYRSADDTNVDQMRVRIWVNNKP